MQWQNPRWRPKYQKPLKSPFLNLQMEWTSSDVAHSQTMCSSIGSENSEKSASNSKYSRYKIGLQSPVWLPWGALLIYLIFGLPYFQLSTTNKTQNWYRGTFDTSVLKIEIWSQNCNILFGFYVPQHGLSSRTILYFTMFKVTWYLKKEMTWGSYNTYVISGHMCSPRSRKRQEKESNKKLWGPKL